MTSRRMDAGHMDQTAVEFLNLFVLVRISRTVRVDERDRVELYVAPPLMEGSLA